MGSVVGRLANDKGFPKCALEGSELTERAFLGGWTCQGTQSSPDLLDWLVTGCVLDAEHIERLRHNAIPLGHFEAKHLASVLEVVRWLHAWLALLAVCPTVMCLIVWL